ncbi:MAG TPA: Gfo/Idh/MocA family oxidoreductase [Longimicrobiaceae bacterium]|nr:Gfo/Idh/MocA family oxidoreductase [Longimicrobiaceae bacterium]
MSPTLQPVRIAVVGAGAIAQVVHLPILSKMRGVNLAGLHDADSAKAETIAGRFNIPIVYKALEDLWKDESIDAIVVCTPSHLHEQQTSEALEAGKYVLCEKPLALTGEGAARVLESPGADSRLMVGMNQRFRPDASALKTFVAGGELGDIFYLRAGWLNRRGGRGDRSWRQRKNVAGGGALMDLGIQLLDLTLWLLDYPQPESLVAHMHRQGGGEVEDSAVLLLQLAGDRIINLEVTWSLLGERDRQYLRLAGTAGSASLAPFRVHKDLDSGLVDVTPTLAPGTENQFTASYRQELQHFVDTIRMGRDLDKPDEHITLMRLIQAAYQSVDENSAIPLHN